MSTKRVVLKPAAMFAFTTDYVSRDISRTNSRSQFKGGLDIGYLISDAATVYAGTWASNIDFNKFDNDNEASAEFDAYAGVTGKFLVLTGISWWPGLYFSW